MHIVTCKLLFYFDSIEPSISVFHGKICSRCTRSESTLDLPPIDSNFNHFDQIFLDSLVLSVSKCLLFEHGFVPSIARMFLQDVKAL